MGGLAWVDVIVSYKFDHIFPLRNFAPSVMYHILPNKHTRLIECVPTIDVHQAVMQSIRNIPYFAK